MQLRMRKGETVEKFTEDRKNGKRTTQLRGFDISSRNCSVLYMDITSAIQRRKLMLKSPEINQLDFH